MKIRKLSPLFIIFTLLCTILLWTLLTDAWQYSLNLFPSNIEYGKFYYSIISRIIWVIPTIILIWMFPHVLAIKPKEFLRNSPKSRLFYLIICLSLIYCFIGMLVVRGEFWINNKEFAINLLLKFVTVGIVEETVFRAWGYNALLSLYSNKKAIIISTAFLSYSIGPLILLNYI